MEIFYIPGTFAAQGFLDFFSHCPCQKPCFSAKQTRDLSLCDIPCSIVVLGILRRFQHLHVSTHPSPRREARSH